MGDYRMSPSCPSSPSPNLSHQGRGTYKVTQHATGNCELIIFVLFFSKNSVDDLPRGLLNGFVRGIDDLPAPVFFAEVTDIFDLGEYLPEGAVARRETGMFLTHHPHFLEDLRVYIETDDLVLVDLKELLGQGDARNNRDIGDLVALLGQEKRGRALGCP